MCREPAGGWQGEGRAPLAVHRAGSQEMPPAGQRAWDGCLVSVGFVGHVTMVGRGAAAASESGLAGIARREYELRGVSIDRRVGGGKRDGPLSRIEDEEAQKVLGGCCRVEDEGRGCVSTECDPGFFFHSVGLDQMSDEFGSFRAVSECGSGAAVKWGPPPAAGPSSRPGRREYTVQIQLAKVLYIRAHSPQVFQIPRLASTFWVRKTMAVPGTRDQALV